MVQSDRSPAPAGEVERVLLADGSLRLRCGSALLPLLEEWLPLLPEPDADGTARATIRVSVASSRPAAPGDPPSFRFVTLDGWTGDDGVTRLWGDGGCHAVVDPAAATAELLSPSPHHPGAAADLDAMCTVASALLLGRLDRVLAHAGAVVDARGRAWLLVGDSRSGKTTTTLNLVRAGWPYLSDDHVVLARGDDDGTVAAEGWPRHFRVDVGWREGVSLGSRVQVDPGVAWPGRWRRAASLAGTLFPRVEPDEPTLLTPIHPADALARAVRSMPWLFFDPPCAPRLLALLRSVAALPAYELRVGKDVYRDEERLDALLAPLATS